MSGKKSLNNIYLFFIARRDARVFGLTSFYLCAFSPKKEKMNERESLNYIKAIMFNESTLKEESKMSEKVDWDGIVGGNFIRLEDGQPKTMILTNWKPSDKFDRPGVEFEVMSEDGKDCNKIWTVTSVRALSQLKPICVKAENEGMDNIKVAVTKMGQGKETMYAVKEV